MENVPSPPPRGRIGRTELLLFNQQLASITRSGVPLERGLREIAADIEKPSMRKLVTELEDDLQSGTSVEEAFARRQSLFPPLYGHIVKAGIQSGRLGEMLTSLNHHLETEGQTRRILLEAVTYPIVVLTIAAILLVSVFLLVIPGFERIFEEMGGTLPALTQFFLAAARNVVPICVTLGAIIAGLALLSVALSASAAGRRFKESIYFHMPVLGRLYHRSLLSRLSDAMALLVSAGCDLPASARLAFAATGSETFHAEGDQLAGQLEKGESIIEAGTLCRHVPPLFFYSMQAGYQRNELQDNLYGLSDMYSQQVRTHQGRLQGLLLPIMILLVGGVIATAIMAMMAPLVAMLKVVQTGG
jgi:type II secretory pathway component PulF